MKPSLSFVASLSWQHAALAAAWVFLCSFPQVSLPNQTRRFENQTQKIEHAFMQINQRFDLLVSLQYQANRKTRTSSVTLEERWNFASDAEGRLRIDYRHPETRIFVSDGSFFTEYLPRHRIALRSVLNANDPSSLEPLKIVLQRLAVDGFRIGNSNELLKNLTSVEEHATQPNILTIKGADPQYQLKIDTEKNIFLKFEKWNHAGQRVFSIQPTDFVQPMPGFWIPTKVITLLIEEGGLRETTTSISGIQVNKTITKNRFDLSLPPDIRVVSRSEWEKSP